ncbi:MAG: leucyl/phenylalanyl-tRNA--protein transferase [Pseudobdellovibrio sp.]
MSANDEIERELLSIFSNPRLETIEGVLVAGGRLSPELLQVSYRNGIFPGPHEGYPMLWFCPDKRGVIDFGELHLPRSFQKWMRQNSGRYRITLNQAFTEVIRNCKTQKRKGQKGTWITSEIEKNYIQLNQLGAALSLEVWRDDQLVGGVYGVQSPQYFSCESMFHLEDNASKLALYELILFLQKRSHTWVDIQMVTPVCESFGGKYISKHEFLTRIGK